MGESRTLAGKFRWKSRKAGERALRYVLPGGLRHRTRDPHSPESVIGRIESEDQGGRALLGRTQTQTGVSCANRRGCGT